MKGIEHPEISWIERTGYPSWKQDPPQIYCEECGRNITEENVYEDENHKYMCCECLLFYHRKDFW